MFRLILARQEQDGLEHDRTVYVTVDVASAEVESFLEAGWCVAGAELRRPPRSRVETTTPALRSDGR